MKKMIDREKKLEEYSLLVSKVDARLKDVHSRLKDGLGIKRHIPLIGLGPVFLYGSSSRADMLTDCLRCASESERLDLVSKIVEIYRFDHHKSSDLALKIKQDFFGPIKGTYGDRIIGTITEESESTILRVWHDFPYLLKPGQADSMGRGVLLEIGQLCDYDGDYGLDKYIETLMPSRSYQTARFPSGIKVRMPSVSR